MPVPGLFADECLWLPLKGLTNAPYDWRPDP